MKKIARRSFLKLMGAGGALLSAGALTACGAASSASTSASGSSAAQSVSSAAGEQTIVYWSMWNEAEPQGQVIEQAAKAYADQTGVKVEINWQGRDISKIIETKLAAGEAIDLYDGAPNTVLKATAQYAADLTEQFKASYPTTDGKPYEEVVLKVLQDTTREYSNTGEINGVPYQPYIQCAFYNKDQFTKANIASVPKTWDELLEDCEKLKTAGFTPITMDDAYMPALPGLYLARVKGSDWVKQLVTENSDEAWQDPAVLQMATAYADMAKKGYFSSSIVSNIYPAGQQDIANGNAAIYLANGSWLVNELIGVTGADFPWGQFAFPAVAGGEGNANADNYSSQVFIVNKASKNIDAAFAFAVFMTTGEWDATLAAQTYGIPAGTESEWPAQLTDAETIFNTVDEWMPWSGGMEENGDLVATIRTAFTELIGGTLTPEQFVQRMVDM